MFKAIEIDNKELIIGYFETKENFLSVCKEKYHIIDLGYSYEFYDKYDIENNRYTKVKYEVELVEIELNKILL